jgi:adenylate cyclase
MSDAAKVTLQGLLGRRKAAGPIMRALLDAVDDSLRIEDPDGNLLLGPAEPLIASGESLSRSPVDLEGEVLGFVVGPKASAETFAAALSWVASREGVTKQLGAEVLNAYREINLIHTFSAKLATLLDLPSIAEASISQAQQLIKASFGEILLLNEASSLFEPVTHANSPSRAMHAVTAGEGFIGAILAQGNAEIVNDVASDPRNTGKNFPLSSVICIPLRIKERIVGLMVVGSETPATYCAGDLKLMSTLGLQTATAIENTILHQRTLEVAKAEALQQTLLEVEEQKRKAEAMLLNILPAEVAKELQRNGSVQPMYFEDVTVCFTDFVGFSTSTLTMAAEDVVQELDRYFTAFDRITERYGLEKLKTIGDSYMFVSGLPTRRASNPINAVLAALEMVEVVRQMDAPETSVHWKVRIGLHTGPVIAGVVGIKKFAFDIWGDTVNLASRMESCGAPNRVNISERTFARVKDFIKAEPRGPIKTKEGHDIEMYFVDGLQERLLTDLSSCPPPLFSRRYQLYFREEAPSFPAHLVATTAS